MFLKIKFLSSGKAKNRFGLSLFLFLFFFLIYFPGISVHAQEGTADWQKPLRYEIDVNAQIIPVFAVDTGGEPVFDLKAEEIELLVNGKPSKIASFTIFRVDEDEGAAGIGNDRQQVIKSMGRINFLIFDSVSNSQRGLKRAREIALGIINESPRTDAFVLLESNPKSGIRYVMGPERDKKKLAKGIKEVVKIAGDRYFSVYNFLKTAGVLGSGGPSGVSAGKGGMARGADETTRAYRERMFMIAMNEVEADRKEYRKQLMIFLHSLTQMKYALKTLTQPRMVFLISGGIPASSLGRHFVRYYKFMGSAAKAINYGGSVLYMINPIPVTRSDITHSLKFMAEESGGKYFGGSDLDKIVTRVQKHTRAYYELAFYPGQGQQIRPENDKLRIKLNCKRKGVTINTVNYSERGKPYREMETIQKKLFALSVVTGGSWSRIVGRVKKVKVKKLKTGKARSRGHKHIRVSIPIPEMMRKAVDVFVVNLEPETMKADIGISHQEADKRLEVEVPVVEGKEPYVVIVEPGQTQCLYNQVK